MSGDDQIAKVGRLAMRVEGESWNAYYAQSDTMEKAIFLGSVRLGLIVDNKERMKRFMDCMREFGCDLIEEQIGVRPTFPDGPLPAPESERGGSA